MSAPSKVQTCPPHLRPAAIKTLHDALPSDERAAFVAALEASSPSDDAAWQGLMVATTRADDDAIEAAAWLQPLPGSTASVWIARPAAAANRALLTELGKLGRSRGLALTQYIASEPSPALDEAMAGGGFARLVDLEYLYLDLARARGAMQESGPARFAYDCKFLPRADSNPSRLGRVLEATYAGTHDCPALDGVRRIEDVMAGYRALGDYCLDHWYIVERNGRDVAALVVAAYPSVRNVELVYMGVVPEARGRGLGRALVDQARRAAIELRAERLVLAVDAKNRPALAVYHNAGFLGWCQRTVYACFGAPPVGE